MTLSFCLSLLLLLLLPEGLKCLRHCEFCGCSKNWKNLFVIHDHYSNYSGIMRDINATNTPGPENHCIISFNTDISRCCKGTGIKLVTRSGYYLLFAAQWYQRQEPRLCEVKGGYCPEIVNHLLSKDDDQKWPIKDQFNNCSYTCLKPADQCRNAQYDMHSCQKEEIKNIKWDILNMSHPDDCWHCKKPVVTPEEQICSDIQFEDKNGATIDPVKASKAMEDLSALARRMNSSSAAISMGTVRGILVKQEVEEGLQPVSFGIQSESDVEIVNDGDLLPSFSRSVQISQEAFEQAHQQSSDSSAFVGVVVFHNLTKDILNSVVLHDEVLGIDMGASIMKLCDTINITHLNVQAGDHLPSCRSWDGNGSRPIWTSNGCETLFDGENITCQCSHLTFFAVLMAPPNSTISNNDLQALTYITYVGCGLSMFFLTLGLFMYCLIRMKSSLTTQILIQLFLALFLLNFSFVINQSVMIMESHVGCQVMAAAMHYSMLASFTWFGLEAFHLCMQVSKSGQVTFRRYLLKLCVVGWGVPTVGVVILLSLGMYGELIINTDKGERVAMCWITNIIAHYVINIGYYALIFLFTFSILVVVLHWLFILKKTRSHDPSSRSSTGAKGVGSILGLCCMLGITWGFAFLAHGEMKQIAYYGFTILNSLQGFFLFLYYCHTSRLVGEGGGETDQSHTNSITTVFTTTKTSTISWENPY